MKKKVLIFLFAINSIMAYGQLGSLKNSGYFTRVTDSVTYRAAATGAHATGYADFYWNEQATVPHFDIWDGNTYEHVFLFGGSGSSATPVSWGELQGTLGDQTDLITALNLKAALASPALTGTPTAPTAAPGTISTQLATAAFVSSAIAAALDFQYVQATGTAISFAIPQFYNTAGVPGTGNITFSTTNLKSGLTQKIYHNHSSEPTYPAEWVRIGGDDYEINTLNIIYAEAVTATRVEYYIQHEQ